MRESLLLSAVKLGQKIFHLLPLKAGLFVARRISFLWYVIDGKRRNVIRANLRTAYAKNKSLKEVRVLTKRVFESYVQTAVEFLRLPIMTSKDLDENIEFIGEQHIHDAMKGGKGFIFLSLHFGNWELCSMKGSKFGYPYRMIVNPQDKISSLGQWLHDLRMSVGMQPLVKDGRTREIIRALQKNEIVTLIADQGGKEGTKIPFFGRSASLSNGAVRLALKFKVPICFASISRKKNGEGHRIEIAPPFQWENREPNEKNLKRCLLEVSQRMEDAITGHPEEYMWFYKVWKHSDEFSVVILDDGRTGHLRQSEAMAHWVKEALKERKIETRIDKVKIEFKSNMMRKLLWFASVLHLPIRLEWLDFFLTRKSFKRLVRSRHDFVVSCGSSTPFINYILSSFDTSKSIVIQRADPVSLDKFDLVVLPRHDVKTDKDDLRKNVVITEITPNLIDADFLQQQILGLQSHYPKLMEKDEGVCRVGLIIGGNTKDFSISEKQVELILNALEHISARRKIEVLITTSRRTPANVERLIKDRFGQAPICPLLIIANENNYPEAMGGILGLSDVVIVSGDSISMVSETVSSRKKSMVFLPDHHDVNVSKYKHKRFVENLHRRGQIQLVELSEIEGKIEVLLNESNSKSIVSDREMLFQRVKAII